MGYITVGTAVLVGAMLCIWLYKANEKLMKSLEKKKLHYEKLSRTVDGLRGMTYFIEINATENYFPKE